MHQLDSFLKLSPQQADDVYRQLPQSHDRERQLDHAAYLEPTGTLHAGYKVFAVPTGCSIAPDWDDFPSRLKFLEMRIEADHPAAPKAVIEPERLDQIRKGRGFPALDEIDLISGLGEFCSLSWLIGEAEWLHDEAISSAHALLGRIETDLKKIQTIADILLAKVENLKGQ